MDTKDLGLMKSEIWKCGTFFFFGKIGHSDPVKSEPISVFAGVVVKSYSSPRGHKSQGMTVNGHRDGRPSIRTDDYV